MLCERCHQRQANVHMTKAINGEKVEQHLCETCAKEENDFGYPFNKNVNMDLQTFLSNLFDTSFQNMPTGFSQQSKEGVKQTACPFCGMTLGEFRNKGKFGCAQCYSTFKDSIEGLVKKLHGNALHGGKVPQRAGADLKVKRRAADLKRRLNKAIEKEEYELAAKLRDEIREIEGGNVL